MKVKFKAVNAITGKEREVSVSLRTLEKIWNEGAGNCAGPCKCRVEPDGTCPKGWPSKGQAVWAA